MGLFVEVLETHSSMKKSCIIGHWRLLAHIIFSVFGTRTTGLDEITFEYISAMTTLVYNKPFNFSQLIFNKLEEVVLGTSRATVDIYPRFIMMILLDLLPVFPAGGRDKPKKMTSQLLKSCLTNSKIDGVPLNVVEELLFGAIVNPNYVPPPNDGFEDVIVEEAIGGADVQVDPAAQHDDVVHSPPPAGQEDDLMFDLADLDVPLNEDAGAEENVEHDEGYEAGAEGDSLPSAGDGRTESSSDSDSEKFIETDTGVRNIIWTNVNTKVVCKFQGVEEQTDEDSDADFDPTEDTGYSALVRYSLT